MSEESSSPSPQQDKMTKNSQVWLRTMSIGFGIAFIGILVGVVLLILSH